MAWTHRRTASSLKARLRRREQEVDDLISRGDYRGAFNHGMGGLQAMLARVFRENPDAAASLYAYYARQMCKAAASVQDHILPSEQDMNKVNLGTSMVPRPRPFSGHSRF